MRFSQVETNSFLFYFRSMCIFFLTPKGWHIRAPILGIVKINPLLYIANEWLLEWALVEKRFGFHFCSLLRKSLVEFCDKPIYRLLWTFVCYLRSELPFSCDKIGSVFISKPQRLKNTTLSSFFFPMYRRTTKKITPSTNHIPKVRQCCIVQIRWMVWGHTMKRNLMNRTEIALRLSRSVNERREKKSVSVKALRHQKCVYLWLHIMNSV